MRVPGGKKMEVIMTFCVMLSKVRDAFKFSGSVVEERGKDQVNSFNRVGRRLEDSSPKGC